MYWSPKCPSGECSIKSHLSSHFSSHLYEDLEALQKEPPLTVIPFTVVFSMMLQKVRFMHWWESIQPETFTRPKEDLAAACGWATDIMISPTLKLQKQLPAQKKTLLSGLEVSLYKTFFISNTPMARLTIKNRHWPYQTESCLQFHFTWLYSLFIF